VIVGGGGRHYPLMNGANIVAAAVVLAVSVPARATPTVKLGYDAPPECPSESEFVEAVRARGADLDAPRAARVPQVMVVSIVRAQGGFAGGFQVRYDGEATNKRQVHGADCRDVADALAVVTAIALQGGSGDAGEVPVAPAPPPSAAADAQPSSAAAPPEPPPPSLRLRARTRWRPPTSVTVPAGTVRFDMGGSIGVYAGATVGLIPSLVLPQYEFSTVVAPFVTTPDGAQRIDGVILKMDGGIWGPATYKAGDTKTDIWGLYLDWNLCLTPTYDTEGLVVLFCFGGGGGALTLDTSAGMSTAEQIVGFVRGEVSGGLQYYLGAGLHVGAQLRGGVEVGQIAAERADGSRVFSSSPTGSAEVLLGVGFHARSHR
jgi:hypothetical protein